MSFHTNNNIVSLAPASSTASSTTTKSGSSASLTTNTTTSHARSKHVGFRSRRSSQKVAIIPYSETFNQVYRKSRRERFAGKIRRFLEVLPIRKPKVETEAEIVRREYKQRGNDDEYRGPETKWKLQRCEHADGKHIKFGCCERDRDVEDVNWRRAKVYNRRN